jgi:hypothetical protein
VFAASEVLLRALRMRRYNLCPSRFDAHARADFTRGFAANRDLYFFRIVKERYSRRLEEPSIQGCVRDSALNA